MDYYPLDSHKKLHFVLYTKERMTWAACKDTVECMCQLNNLAQNMTCWYFSCWKLVLRNSKFDIFNLKDVIFRCIWPWSSDVLATLPFLITLLNLKWCLRHACMLFVAFTNFVFSVINYKSISTSLHCKIKFFTSNQTF